MTSDGKRKPLYDRVQSIVMAEVSYTRLRAASSPSKLTTPLRVLSRGWQGPGPYDAGSKDTVFVPAGRPVRIIARFGPYRGKYVLHCHNLEHEDMTMITNFEVV